MSDDDLVSALIREAQLNNEMNNTSALNRARQKLLIRLAELRDKAWKYDSLSH